MTAPARRPLRYRHVRAHHCPGCGVEIRAYLAACDGCQDQPESDGWEPGAQDWDAGRLAQWHERNTKTTATTSTKARP